jgi:hypothetical protein
MRVFTSLLLTLLFFTASAQKKIAVVSGQVIDENENPLPGVSVTILGKSNGIVTNDTGFFRITVTAGKATALIFSYTGHT